MLGVRCIKASERVQCDRTNAACFNKLSHMHCISTSIIWQNCDYSTHLFKAPNHGSVSLSCLQNCDCYDSYTFSNVNGTVSCLPATVNSHRSISITLLVVVPALVVFFILLDGIVRIKRGSYERLVLRWIKRKGAPGEHMSSGVQT